MMKGLDTNVLVRYLTQDDQRQARIAASEIEGAAKRDEKLLIRPLVLCELVWVLESAYGFGKAEIVRVLDLMMRTAQFEISEKETLWQALDEYHRGKGDFSDYYLGIANEDDGAEITLTFDKGLKGSRYFKVIGN
jgi:predicted nucleic-acid-binding protein